MSWMTEYLGPNPTVEELIGEIGALLIGNRTHVAKLFATYTLPTRTILGSYLRFQSGRPWEARLFDPSYGTDYQYAETAGKRTTPSWTNFAMEFIGGGYFIHDAPWRSWYGPGANLYNGTHGCVNVPYSPMATLWNWAPNGTTVVVQY